MSIRFQIKKEDCVMKEKEELVELRQNFKLMLLENPDYFGNLTEAGLALEGLEPVIKMVSNTYYEELTCVSFHPETDELRAVVRVKQTSGYAGGPCTDGSKEYVRFYVDYDRDGDWEDEGVVNFDAHDLPFKEELCYAVRLRIDPEKRTCCDEKPVLPRVRAILSWNNEPPANQPGWLPVWGNRLEANIQIAPRKDLWCLLKKKFVDLGISIDPAKLELLADVPYLEAKPTPLPQATLLTLKAQYGDEVEDARFGYKLVHATVKEPSQPALLDTLTTLKASGVEIAKVVEFLKVSQFDTSYEEVKCVGLNRDLSVLHAGVLIKRPCGYSGDLCHKGSLEYVAFYMDFGSGWEYMGTTSVRVHDISQIPKDGLWYNAALPVSLTKHQKSWCKTGKAKVRAILSWNVAPTPNDPDYVAHWGDWEECHVEIKPLPKGVQPGKVIPVIESLGGMPVSLINSSGYANGVSPAGLTGIDSPFDGRILINGIVANAPDSSVIGVARVRYRIMVKEPSGSTFQPSLRKFTIYKTEISAGMVSPQVPVTQTPNADGWMDYYPDFYAPDIVSIDQNLLGVYVPAEGGLHELYVEISNPNTGLSALSNTVKFVVDKTAPKVDIEITSGTGNCGVFTKGDAISGTFSIEATHCYSVSLSVTPAAEAHGAKPIIVASGGRSSLKYGSGLTCPKTTGTWELDTSAMDPCGYNIRIHGEDRTIVSSRWFGRESWDIEGFCLMAKGKKGGCG